MHKLNIGLLAAIASGWFMAAQAVPIHGQINPEETQIFKAAEKQQQADVPDPPATDLWLVAPAVEKPHCLIYVSGQIRCVDIDSEGVWTVTEYGRVRIMTWEMLEAFKKAVLHQGDK